MDSCCICYEEFGSSCANRCTTSCGHVFHTGCLLKNAEYRDECPMCRAVLLERNNEDEDEDEDGDSDSEYNYDDDADDDDDDGVHRANVTVEQVTKKMMNLGYTMEDFIYIFMGRVVHEKDAEIKKWKDRETLHDEIFDAVYDIKTGVTAVDYRDGRSYAEVLLTTK